jgi:mRNA interferase HigB
MQVHLIKKQSIEDYVLFNSQSKNAFEKWLTIIKRVDWNIPSEIISTFNSADILGKGSNRVIFILGEINIE